MIKVIGTGFKRDDLTMEEFIRYQSEIHAPISAKAPGLRGYVVSEVLRKLDGTLEADAFIEQWFDDEASMEQADNSPEVAAAWKDIPNFAKMSGTWWVTREHVYIPRPITGPGSISQQVWLT